MKGPVQKNHLERYLPSTSGCCTGSLERQDTYMQLGYCTYDPDIGPISRLVLIVNGHKYSQST